MHRYVLLGGVLMVLVAGSGCMSMGAGIAPSTRPITDSMKVTEIGPASGSSWGINVFGIPLAESGHGLALRRALDTSGADALIEVTSDNRIYYLFVVTLYETRVHGTAVNLSK